ncbi:hypothetical protein AVEN_56698-1 [Araneus ventricosus]|uniref:Uncharacterized protein n=1 Tax=Araneus ventricosus TaxID=182803 RepID=A0A4Y2TKY8_ARAVE|nr:hypothetical protein AVEN_56698-1 [Araneus ventricosus]
MPTMLQERITAVVTDSEGNMPLNVWPELDYRWDMCRVTKGEHIEHLKYIPEALGEHGITGSGLAWTAELGDELGAHFVDLSYKSKIPEKAIIFSIGPSGEEILECARYFHVTSRPVGQSIKGQYLDHRGVVC